MSKKRKLAEAKKALVSVAIITAICNSTFAASSKSYTTTTVNDGKTSYVLVKNPKNGPVLGYSENSGVKLIEVTEKGYTYAFKDLNKNGKLDVFEDWRKSIDERASDLAKKLTTEQIAGLMLFSSHERAIEEGLTDAQKKYLSEDNLRAVLNAGSNNVEAAVQWNNEMQAYVESLDNPIPVNFSSDPRSTAGRGDAYSAGSTGNGKNDISLWPSNLGLSATFDTNIMYEFAKASSAEYRAMGISTALGPQIDLATEPRWLRIYGTFGEDTKLAIDMTQAYVDGSQSTYDEKGKKDLGWGKDSINCMIKHWPGDGAGEAGRESHTAAGKYAVYPGDNYEEHKKPFTEGGFKLKGKTKAAVAVMDSYSIALDKDGNSIANRAGSAYNTKKMNDLRNEASFDGVVCTDWGVTKSLAEGGFIGTAWGMEDKSVDERHYELIMNGVDMFGGNNDSKPVIGAYNIMVEKMGKEKADERMQLSAKRILKMCFLPGLFENPYLDITASKATVGNEQKNEAGYNAQLASVVMLKNKNNVIRSAKKYGNALSGKTIYIPMTYIESIPGARGPSAAEWLESMNLNIAREFGCKVITDIEVKDAEGNITSYQTPDLKDVDMVIVGMTSPNNGNNFSKSGMTTNEDGSQSFYPLSLQYEPYTAKSGRKVSISGDILDDGTKQNRSYNGAISHIYNEQDYISWKNAVAAVEATGKDIPLVVCMVASGPVCYGEIEKKSNAILMGFSVSDKAFFDIIAGNYEPRGLLPLQMPKDMETVEAQQEDVAHDMECYKDSEGNVYDFAYGLNYKGVIKDKRTKTYASK